MDGLLPATPEANDESGVSIPLDLSAPILPYREQGGLSIRVERLPFGARLSNGRNNGDNTWSLTLEDLPGLMYLPPEDINTSHALTVRVIRVDGDGASTLMRFDVPIAAGGPPAAAAPVAPPSQPKIAEQVADNTPVASTGDVALGASGPVEANLPHPAPPVAQAPQNTAPIPEAPPPAPQQTAGVDLGATAKADFERRLSEERASWEAEQQGRVAAAVQKAEADARAKLSQSTDIQLSQEVDRRLSEARATWEGDHQARVAAAVQKAEADARAQLDQNTEVRLALESERKLSEARASWEAEQQGRIAVAVQDAVQKARAEVSAQSGQANETQLAQEVGRRLGEARSKWEAELQGRIAVAVDEARKTAGSGQPDQNFEARLAQELNRRLSEARTTWETEQQGRTALAVQEAVHRARAEAQNEFEQSSQLRLGQEVDRRLADARTSWEAEQQGRTALAVQDAVQRAQADARAQMDQTSEARIAQEVDRRLSEARVSWESELQTRVTSAVQDAVQRTEADIRTQLSHENEARLAEVLQRRLSESRAIWDSEQQGRVAAAVQEAVLKSESDARLRLEQAQRDWRDSSAREMADLSARYTQAEAALNEFRNRPPPGQETEATLLGLRADLSNAQALIRTRESELAESRHAYERARAEIAGHAVDAQANVERNREAWNAERAALLADAEDNAKLRVRQALEKWQHETEAALAKAQQEWADGEQTRLAVAEAQWRQNIGVAKSRAPIAKLTGRRGRIRLSGRVKRFVLIVVAIAAALYFYPRVEPMVVDRMWPKMIEYKGEIEPSVRERTAEIKAWLGDVVKRSKEAAQKKKPK